MSPRCQRCRLSATRSSWEYCEACAAGEMMARRVGGTLWVTLLTMAAALMVLL